MDHLQPVLGVPGAARDRQAHQGREQRKGNQGETDRASFVLVTAHTLRILGVIASRDYCPSFLRTSGSASFITSGKPAGRVPPAWAKSGLPPPRASIRGASSLSRSLAFKPDGAWGPSA